MSDRPSISVIVPFAGSRKQLASLLGVLAALELGDQDEIFVALNRAPAEIEASAERVQIISATGLRSPGFARNQAAAIARGDWLLFIDADTQPDPTLLDCLFSPAPAAGTAVLAGEIRDIAPAGGVVARHVVARHQMSQLTTLGRGAFAYAQTANCAVARTAFAAVGGFVPEARTAEDADLCFRLTAAGYAIESRPHAVVIHSSRATARAWVGQLIRHGAGAAWLEHRYPGSLPAPSPSALIRRLLRSGWMALHGLARADQEAAAFALLDVVGALAFELGRLLPNTARREPGFYRAGPGEVQT